MGLLSQLYFGKCHYGNRLPKINNIPWCSLLFQVNLKLNQNTAYAKCLAFSIELLCLFLVTTVLLPVKFCMFCTGTDCYNTISILSSYIELVVHKKKWTSRFFEAKRCRFDVLCVLFRIRICVRNKKKNEKCIKH